MRRPFSLRPRVLKERDQEGVHLRKRFGSHYRICLDFDGVVAQFHRTRDLRHAGPPVPGALKFVQELLSEHYELIILTVRPAELVTAWLADHGFPQLGVTDRKPSALLYVDDKGYRFDGNWQAVKVALHAPCWWQQGEDDADAEEGNPSSGPSSAFETRGQGGREP